jgi:nicotinate-nucleotide adenylyltransferase
MTALGRIGILGGTFDPFHLGHLAVAHVARTALALDEVRIVPASVPPHRLVQPRASAHHRFAMAALGIANEPVSFVLDEIELTAAGPSYTASTLARLQESGLGATQLFFITGVDAFVEIATWREYPDVLDRAHFVVVSRPGHAVATLHDALPSLVPRMQTITRDETAAVPDLSQPSILLIDAPTPDVSATMVRQRAAAGRPLTDLVPPLVAGHLMRHRLYDSAPHFASPAAGPMKAASPLHEQEPA